MPLALEPGQRCAVVLDSDVSKPADSRPTFYVKALSMREQLRLSDEMDAALAHGKAEKIFDAACELLSKYLLGWSNMGSFTFGTDDLRDLLAHHEARELLRKVLSNSHLQPEEKKS